MNKNNIINFTDEQSIYRLDLYWSIFMATVNSPDPFLWLPSECPYFSEDLEEFLTLIEQLPAIDTIQEFLKINSKNSKVLDILQWLFNYIEKTVRVDPINLTVLSSALQTAALSSFFKPSCYPSIVYRIVPILETETWTNQAESFGTIFCYMPIRIEWLIRLLTGESKTFPVGNMKITNDLELAKKLTDISYSWGKSLIGGKIRIVAVVQVVNHPSLKKKCKIIQRVNGFTEIFKNVDPEFISIRFLLIYSDRNIPKNTFSKSGLINFALNSQRLQVVQVGCLLTMIFLFILSDISNLLV